MDPIDPQWGWLLLAVFLATAEIFLPGFYLIWVGAAAVVVGLVVLVVPIPLPAQIALFAAIAAATVVVMRRRAAAKAAEPEPAAEEPIAHVVGRRAVVVGEISGGAGRVKLSDSVWDATGPDMEVGAMARVLAIDGLTLIVGPASRGSRRPPTKTVPIHIRTRSRRRRGRSR